MTNEEAIARIREHMIIHKNKEPRAIYITKALEMAIKALEQFELNTSYNGVKTELEPSEECISRAAAINTAISAADDWDGGCDAYREEMIREALEALPYVTPRTNLAETSQDCISRQAVIDKATSWNTHFTDSERYVSLSDIMDLPSVTPQRPKGKWIEKSVIHREEAEKAIEEWQSAKCSYCGLYLTTPYMYYFMTYRYCPNCGAEMSGGGEDA